VWTWADRARLEHLEQPPIVEVICGVHFDPLEVDPVLAGAFWAERRDRFPHRKILPALHAAPDPMGVMVALGGAMPLRTWLISADETHLVQIQQDRFYLNWRRRPQGGDYPHFASSGEHGLLAQALREFDAFGRFCEQTLAKSPTVRRVELGKVDHFAEGDSWSGSADLARMMPGLAPFLALCEGGRSDVLWRVHDRKGESEFTATAASTLAFEAGNPQPRKGLKFETSVVLPATAGDLEAKFRIANKTVNAAFDILVPASERQTRFCSRTGSP